MSEPIRFVPHPPAPAPGLDALLDLCFGSNRQQRTASRIREHASRIDPASFLALDGARLLGSVECWNIVWDSGQTRQPMALLGPLAAHPQHRRQRIGGRLMDLALAELDRLQLPVMLIGDAPYYGRWGFAADFTGSWQLPGPVAPERLLLRAPNGRRFDARACIAGDRLPRTPSESAHRPAHSA